MENASKQPKYLFLKMSLSFQFSIFLISGRKIVTAFVQIKEIIKKNPE